MERSVIATWAPKCLATSSVARPIVPAPSTPTRASGSAPARRQTCSPLASGSTSAPVSISTDAGSS